MLSLQSPDTEVVLCYRVEVTGDRVVDGIDSDGMVREKTFTQRPETLFARLVPLVRTLRAWLGR